MIDLPNLIARIEAATGPDRALDAEIHFAIHGRPSPFGGETWDEVARSFHIKKFTKSLDDAMTLIPEDGWLQHLGHNLAGWNCRVERQGVSRARKTQALAVCAAALKARNA